MRCPPKHGVHLIVENDFILLRVILKISKMRTDSKLLALFGLLVRCTPVSSWHLYRRAAVVVTSPNSGSTIVAKSDFNIEWQHSTDSNVTISLRQGTPENMTLAHVIAGTSNPSNIEFRSLPLPPSFQRRSGNNDSDSKHTQQRQLRLAFPR